MRSYSFAAACLALLAVLAMAPAASADFHGACTPAGQAGVNLTRDASGFVFSGEVICGASQQIDITNLVLAGPGSTSTSATPASCGPCGSLQASGTSTQNDAGTYTVSMTFTVRTSSGAVFADRSRIVSFTYSGSGQPVPVGAAPKYTDFCQGTTRGASTDFIPDPLPAMSATFGGMIVCRGADSIVVTGLTATRVGVRQQNVSVVPSQTYRATAATVGGCVSPCADPVTGTGRVTGVPVLPGQYDVTLTFTVSVSGLTFTRQSVTTSFLWGGFGPAEHAP